jgi:hypothetical protein
VPKICASAWSRCACVRAAQVILQLLRQTRQADELALRVVGVDAQLLHQLPRLLRRVLQLLQHRLEDVPASEPISPAEANAASVPVVSSMDSPPRRPAGPPG